MSQILINESLSSHFRQSSSKKPEFWCGLSHKLKPSDIFGLELNVPDFDPLELNQQSRIVSVPIAGLGNYVAQSNSVDH